MGLTADEIRVGLDALAANEPAIARALNQAGYPAPRSRPRGLHTLLRAIVGQQVSVAAADSVWRRMEALLGADIPPQYLLAQDHDALRACGLSRQKQSYARSLCELAVAGLDFDNLPADDEAAIAELTCIKGVGRWTAEIYLLFAEGRGNIWPAGDLAVQEGTGRIFGLDHRPAERETRKLAESWRPHRSALAVFTWHIYDSPAL